MSLIILNSENGKADAIKAIQRANINPLSPLAVTIERYTKLRSTRQNRLYFDVLGEITENTGIPKDKLHETFKAYFIGVEDLELPNKMVIQIPISTTTLDTKQFADYIEQIKAYAQTEMGVRFIAKEYA